MAKQRMRVKPIYLVDRFGEKYSDPLAYQIQECKRIFGIFKSWVLIKVFTTEELANDYLNNS